MSTVDRPEPKRLAACSARWPADGEPHRVLIDPATVDGYALQDGRLVFRAHCAVPGCSWCWSCYSRRMRECGSKAVDR